MTNKVWTISNVFSMLRIIAAIPLFFSIQYNMKLVAVLITVFAGFTDWADGYYARKRNEVTEFGKKMDPIADKTFSFSAALAMLIQNYIPVWFVILVVVRDSLMIFGSYIVNKKAKFVLPSIMIGKASYVMLGLVLTGLFFQVKHCETYGLYLVAVLLIISYLIYLYRAILFLRNNKEKVKDL